MLESEFVGRQTWHSLHLLVLGCTAGFARALRHEASSVERSRAYETKGPTTRRQLHLVATVFPGISRTPTATLPLTSADVSRVGLGAPERTSTGSRRGSAPLVGGTDDSDLTVWQGACNVQHSSLV